MGSPRGRNQIPVRLAQSRPSRFIRCRLNAVLQTESRYSLRQDRAPKPPRHEQEFQFSRLCGAFCGPSCLLYSGHQSLRLMFVGHCVRGRTTGIPLHPCVHSFCEGHHGIPPSYLSAFVRVASNYRHQSLPRCSSVTPEAAARAPTAAGCRATRSSHAARHGHVGRWRGHAELERCQQLVG